MGICWEYTGDISVGFLVGNRLGTQTGSRVRNTNTIREYHGTPDSGNPSQWNHLLFTAEFSGSYCAEFGAMILVEDEIPFSGIILRINQRCFTDRFPHQDKTHQTPKCNPLDLGYCSSPFIRGCHWWLRSESCNGNCPKMASLFG